MPLALALTLALTAEPSSPDLAEIQRAVVAELAESAPTRLATAYCVWVAPPGGEPDGIKAPSTPLDLRAPSAAFLASVPVKDGLTLRSGPACTGKMEGARVRETREPAWIVEVGRPELNGATATVEGGASCGGECSTWYRFTLERGAHGWRVTAKDVLRLS